MQWQLAHAKNRFSEVVNLALSEGPQRISRRKDTVIVLAEAEYEALRGNQPDFRAFLLGAPSMEELDLSRDTAPMREASL